LCHEAFASPIADSYTLKISNLHDAKSSPSRFFEDHADVQSTPFYSIASHFARARWIVVCTVDTDFAALAQRIHDALGALPDIAAQLVRVNRPAV
jgi:hypothetical protein